MRRLLILTGLVATVLVAPSAAAEQKLPSFAAPALSRPTTAPTGSRCS